MISIISSCLARSTCSIILLNTWLNAELKGEMAAVLSHYVTTMSKVMHSLAVIQSYKKS